MTIRDVALDFLQRGWSPIRLKPREKIPVDVNWGMIGLDPRRRSDLLRSYRLQHRPAARRPFDTASPTSIWTAPRRFVPSPLHPAGRRTLCSAAPAHPNATGSISDLISDASITSAVLKFADPTIKDAKKTKLLELRVGERLHDPKAAQTLAPGSIHPSGEPVRWSNGHDPIPAVCAGRRFETLCPPHRRGRPARPPLAAGHRHAQRRSAARRPAAAQRLGHDTRNLPSSSKRSRASATTRTSRTASAPPGTPPRPSMPGKTAQGIPTLEKTVRAGYRRGPHRLARAARRRWNRAGQHRASGPPSGSAWT